MMSVSTGAVTGFAEEARLLLQIAANVGRYRRDDQFADFDRSLQALGMEATEVAALWGAIKLSDDAVSDSAEIDWLSIECNTHLANCLSIRLNGEAYPRNLLLYRLMALHFSDFFQVAVTGSVHMGGKKSKGRVPERRLVHFPKQPVGAAANGRLGPLSVYRVLSGVQPSEFSERVLRAAKPLCLALGDDVGLRLAELMIGCHMEIPSWKMAQQLARVITAGKRGDMVTIVGVFCPDYAYEETGDPHVPYRYTFDGLGSGVGLVAQQFVRIVPVISSFLDELGVPHRIVLGIGDFEADSEDVLQQVGLSQEAFLERCRESLNCFASALSDDLPLTLEMFGEERSRKRFYDYAADAFSHMVAGRFGRMAELHDELQRVLDRIPRQYRTFYERWYGRQMEDLEVNRIVYQQGSEYAAAARIYEEDFGNNLIMLAGDRPEMHRFNTFYSVYPTLCAKRAY